MPARDQCDYSAVLDVDLAGTEPCVAGPKRPQDRIALGRLKEQFMALLTSAEGYGKRDSSQRTSVRLGGGQPPRPGGGDQFEDALPASRKNDTNALTEAEMMNNRPTPGLPERGSWPSCSAMSIASRQRSEVCGPRVLWPVRQRSHLCPPGRDSRSGASRSIPPRSSRKVPGRAVAHATP
jgi:hypothetical protein